MLRGVVLTQYRHVTDGRMDRQTDGIAVASTALAMWALLRAVKKLIKNWQVLIFLAKPVLEKSKNVGDIFLRQCSRKISIFPLLISVINNWKQTLETTANML